MKVLISWAHSDCSYSLLKVLELIPNIEVFIPDKILSGFITFLLDYNEWPIGQYSHIIKPLSSLSSVSQIDYYFAEIINLQWDKKDRVTDSQIEWGVENLDLSKIILYSYNVVTFEKFKYKHKFPLITSSLPSYKSYKGPKHFFHGSVQMLPYTPPKNYRSLFLVQNSYEIQKRSLPLLKTILRNKSFSDYDIRYYGFTEDEDLKKINYCKGKRLSRKEINDLIINEMTFSLHLKDVEGYGYHPLKCMFAGRPVINLKSNITGMTYEEYMINDMTSIIINDIYELLEVLDFYSTQERVNRFSRRCSDYIRGKLNFKEENKLTADFLQKAF